MHRKKIRPDGVIVKAERAADEQKSEFMASTDTWFRPVQFANGPDGCLYVIDMYRETIEHPWSLPESLKKHLDLNSGNDRGRIYRIVPDGFKRRPPACDFDRLPQHIRRHVVEQDRIDTKSERLLQLNQRVHFHFDFNHRPELSAQSRHGLLESTRGRDVIVLDQNGIIQTEAMVEPAAAADRVFLQ